MAQWSDFPETRKNCLLIAELDRECEALTKDCELLNAEEEKLQKRLDEVKTSSEEKTKLLAEKLRLKSKLTALVEADSILLEDCIVCKNKEDVSAVACLRDLTDRPLTIRFTANVANRAPLELLASILDLNVQADEAVDGAGGAEAAAAEGILGLEIEAVAGAEGGEGVEGEEGVEAGGEEGVEAGGAAAAAEGGANEDGGEKINPWSNYEYDHYSTRKEC